MRGASWRLRLRMCWTTLLASNPGLYHLPALCPWTSSLTSLNLNFSSHNVKEITVILDVKYGTRDKSESLETQHPKSRRFREK